MGEQPTVVYPVQVVGAAIVDSLTSPTRLLVGQRSAPPALAGLWEFPGGKVEPDEACEDALLRELREELGITARLGAEITGPHTQGWVLNEKAAMRVWWAEITDGRATALQDHAELRWVPLDATVLELPWIPADFPIVMELLAGVRAA
ncbi:MAG: (deoxy)nucleoside triphosphate pyrophosphohydrolase [Rothia sp. (in: high G+C Gram-positive bacteria)]|uniref:(deoxy)nucleoside triphosphate pyrophosphohydrolase n=1 Tax=Rothia sp. (in: high G+C Gram-positive bacteria) TaxID=1885016 RepID=UPI002710FB88|nr:(deoxy)nucleoside triphosphate pyrophosphohydrolase [Rothia sp. (in: high G+C Gram-positive bacteria)]